MYKIALKTEEKIYYLTKNEDNAVYNVFGHSYIWGVKNIRLFRTLTDAKKVLQDMKRYGTGKNAYIVEEKE